MTHFGSLRATLAAPAREQRRAIASEPVIRRLGAARQAMLWALRDEVEERPYLGNGRALVDYLRLACGRSALEEVRVFYLDVRMCLLREEMFGPGAPDSVIVGVAQLVGRALELGARYMLVAHNHPSGRIEPSQADRQLTSRLSVAAHALEIGLLDHIIVSEGDYFSFKEAGLL